MILSSLLLSSLSSRSCFEGVSEIVSIEVRLEGDAFLRSLLTLQNFS